MGAAPSWISGAPLASVAGCIGSPGMNVLYATVVEASAQHALVLVNHGKASGMELLALARRVADSVEQRFGVRLEPEPRIVGAQW